MVARMALARLVRPAILFAINKMGNAGLLLWVGRVNFASVFVALYAGYRFVGAIATLFTLGYEPWLLVETLVLAHEQ